MEPLFPALPESLADLSDEELASLRAEHLAAIRGIRENDQELTAGLSGEQIIEQLRGGVAQLKEIDAEATRREGQVAAFVDEVETLTAEVLDESEAPETAASEEDTGDEGDEGDDTGDEGNGDEASVEAESEETDEPAEEPALVASAGVGFRRPPEPSRSRGGSNASVPGTALVATAGIDGSRAGVTLDRSGYAKVAVEVMRRRGKPKKYEGGPEERITLATADIAFPEERWLREGQETLNSEKVRQAIPAYTGWGSLQGDALVASGGLCAPLTPFYSIPSFATQARPVRDALPSFRADRGGVNVPTPSTIGDITSAITVITEANDAAGGTFATKSCQDFTCPAFVETAVTIISHCREFGNLNARAWPESVAHENDLTMAAHARTAETLLLDRIHALSIATTNGAETLSAYIYIVDAIVKARFGIIGRLRMDPNTQFRALMPWWLPQMLLLDTVSTQFDRFRSEEQLVAYLRSAGITPSFYIDSPTATGGVVSQLPDSAQTAAALDGLPDKVEWAIFPEGTFLHLDGGTLELGIVRDSSLNQTNDYQVFGETFENVARIGPAQAALWVQSDVCPVGQFPPAGTARTCE